MEKKRELFEAFPFEPYESQQTMMRDVYGAVERGSIGFFESPTGTGKSLSMLCAVLSWANDTKDRRTDGQPAAPQGTPQSGPGVKRPYATLDLKATEIKITVVGRAQNGLEFSFNLSRKRFELAL